MQSVTRLCRYQCVHNRGAADGEQCGEALKSRHLQVYVEEQSRAGDWNTFPLVEEGGVDTSKACGKKASEICLSLNIDREMRLAEVHIDSGGFQCDQISRSGEMVHCLPWLESCFI